MKRLSAVIIDSVVGSILVFACTYLIADYFTYPLYSFVCGVCAVAVVLVISRRNGLYSKSGDEFSRASATMFEQFMFEPNSPLNLLCEGFARKGLEPTKHDNFVEAKGTAFFYKSTVSKADIAHYYSLGLNNAKRVAIVCESVPPDAKALALKLEYLFIIQGDSAYRLYRSLSALPTTELPYKKSEGIKGVLKGAIAYKKWKDYLLSGALILVLGMFGNFKVFSIVVASICAVLSACCIIVPKTAKRNKKSSEL